MVKKHEKLDALFFALSDPTRRAILANLSKGSANMGQVAQPFSMSLVAVSKHVRVLEEAGLVKRKVFGRVHELTLTPKALTEAQTWLETTRVIWQGHLDRPAEKSSASAQTSEDIPVKKKKGEGKKKKKKKTKK